MDRRDTIWAGTTLEQLLSRQVVPPRAWDALQANSPTARSTDRGLFRPGLRVVAMEERTGRRDADRWLDHPAGALIEG